MDGVDRMGSVADCRAAVGRFGIATSDIWCVRCHWVGRRGSLGRRQSVASRPLSAAALTPLLELPPPPVDAAY